MKILLVSDSHGEIDSLKALIKRYPQMDLYLHLGDSELSDLDIHPYIAVKGNCDFFYSYPESREIPTEFAPILLAHKPTFIYAYHGEAKIFIHGHTHKPFIGMKNDIITINPGSISYPRSDFGRTYATMETSHDKVEIKIFSLEDNRIVLEKTFRR